SCCEVLNNLIFPAHEQHHNNSFLVASVVMGQSNMAAGATIGSNHNSRSNDNEIQAGRGFWPGLCTSLKHSSRFASFVLISKSDYPAELDIALPFSLLNNNVSKDQIEVMPAFWWLYNMYALARNSWKFTQRDKRIFKVQNIEFETFAPDTVEEIIHAMRLLEIWTAKAHLMHKGESYESHDDTALSELGRQLLVGDEKQVNGLEVLGENMEHSKRKAVILKPYKGYHAYRDMLYYYAGKNLLAYIDSTPETNVTSIQKTLAGKRVKEWVNLGGQIMQKKDLDRLRSDIGSEKLSTWEAIHNRYDKLWDRYQTDKQKHAFAAMCWLCGTDKPGKKEWGSFLDKVIEVQEYINDQVYISRKKDYENHFRQSTFRNMDEMTAAIGTIEDNSFIVQVRQETKDLKKLVMNIKKQLLNK
ncbi:MAG: DUF4954 family protein, partial [Bacteroidales bacterium]|nr:DUF4954 family protein [Bacteroidales bacterium]